MFWNIFGMFSCLAGLETFREILFKRWVRILNYAFHNFGFDYTEGESCAFLSHVFANIVIYIYMYIYFLKYLVTNYESHLNWENFTFKSFSAIWRKLSEIQILVFARYGVLAAMLLKTQIFIVRVRQSKKNSRELILMTNSGRPFEKSGTTITATQCHITEDWILRAASQLRKPVA